MHYCREGEEGKRKGGEKRKGRKGKKEERKE
jgi:hypothetical protein